MVLGTFFSHTLNLLDLAAIGSVITLVILSTKVFIAPSPGQLIAFRWLALAWLGIALYKVLMFKYVHLHQHTLSTIIILITSAAFYFDKALLWKCLTQLDTTPKRAYITPMTIAIFVFFFWALVCIAYFFMWKLTGTLTFLPSSASQTPMSPQYTLPMYLIGSAQWLYFSGSILSLLFLPIVIHQLLKLRTTLRSEYLHPLFINRLPLYVGVLFIMFGLNLIAWVTSILMQYQLIAPSSINQTASYTYLFVFLAFTICLTSQTNNNTLFANPAAKNTSHRERYLDSDNIKKIDAFVENEKPFLQKNLSLERFSQAVGLSPKAVSTIINDIHHMSFSEYINSHRIALVKVMLLDTQYEHMNNLDIGLSAGFKSRSSFYECFKSFEKMTPSQFRQQASQAE